MRWNPSLNPLLRFGLKFLLIFGLCDALSITSWSDKPLAGFLSAYARASNYILVVCGQYSHVTKATIVGPSLAGPPAWRGRLRAGSWQPGLRSQRTPFGFVSEQDPKR
jgi:hypothetical protein